MTNRAIALAALSLCLVAGIAHAQRTPPRVMSLVEVLSGDEEQVLRWPVAVASDGGDRFAVADAFRPRMLVFRRVGVSWALDRQVTLPAAPAGLAWSNGRWVLSLRGSEGLVAVPRSADTLATIELPSGAVPGALAALPGGDLLVHDSAASAVLRITREGTVSGSTPVDGGLTGLADDGSGGFLAAIGEQGRILRFDAASKQQPSWDLPSHGPVPAWPAGLAAEPGGRVFVADRHGGRILVLDGTGRWIGLGSREGWDPGLLRYPRGIARLPGGDLIVADQGNGRVQIFRLTSNGSGS